MRERNLLVQEKHRSVASPCPKPGTWPTIQASALMGNRTGNLSVCKPALITEPHQPGPKSFLRVWPKKADLLCPGLAQASRHTQCQPKASDDLDQEDLERDVQEASSDFWECDKA